MTSHQINEKIDSFLNSSSATVREIIKKENTFLVGGIVRDIIIGRPDIKDIDIVTERPLEIIANYSNKIRAKVLLDKDYEIYRVFLKDEKRFYLDISKLQGNNILEDLSRRDFSINAVAVKFSREGFKLIDPFNGIVDIEEKLIRMTEKKNLTEDPLRIIRAFRLKAELGFQIDSATKNEIKEVAEKLNNVAEERIKGEIFKILNTKNAKDTFYELYLNKVLSVIFPFISEYSGYFCGRRHKLDLLMHSFKTMEIIESYCNDNSFPVPVSDEVLNYETEYEAKLHGLLKLTALLHDVGKLFTRNEVNGKVTYYEHEKVGSEYLRDFLQKRRFATETVNFIVQLVRFHMYPFHIMDFGERDISFSPRIYLKIEKVFGDRVSLLFNLAISDSYATSDDLQTKKVIDMLKKLYNLYIEYKNRERELAILNGKDIMQLLNIGEGPAVGKILSALKEASLSGKIMSEDEAKEFVKSYYEKNL